MKLTTSIIIFLLAGYPGTQQTTKEVITRSGLRYTVLKEGTGATAKTGQQVSIYESMGYPGGKQFYALEKPTPPIKFTIGKKQVIAGLDEAVTGMKVGEIRRLIVPPSLSRRTEYPSYLSPDSTLVYKVELVQIIKSE